MEKKFLRYTLVAVIFFVGLSMGVSYQENSRTKDLQSQLTDFEDEITEPNNEFEPVSPYDRENNIYSPKIKHNVFSSLAKDGEYVIKKGLELVLDKSDDVFRFIFGVK